MGASRKAVVSLLRLGGDPRSELDKFWLRRVQFRDQGRPHMKRMLLALAVVALAAPFAALAAGSGNGASPAQACKTEQTAMGNDAFKALYGTNADKSNAFGKCVAKKAT